MLPPRKKGPKAQGQEPTHVSAPGAGLVGALGARS